MPRRPMPQDRYVTELPTDDEINRSKNKSPDDFDADMADEEENNDRA